MRFSIFFLTLASFAIVNPNVSSADGGSGICCESACDASCNSGRLGPVHRLGNLFKRDCTTANYFALHTGWNGLDDYNGNDFQIPIPPPSPAIREGSFNDGWLIGGAIGKRINRAIRAEVEYTFRDNTADQWVVNQVPLGDWNGHFNNFSIMTNLYHDFSGYSVLGWTPYIGGGIGVSFLDGEFNTATLNLDVDESSFAYQLIAGGSRSLTNSVDAFVEYRFLETEDFDLTNLTPPTPQEFGEDPYESHSVFVGLRFYR